MSTIINRKRKIWNKRQREFRRKLLSFEQHDQALHMFFSQHAMLHSADMSESEAWSYEDEIFSSLSDAQARVIPTKCMHSIAWILWHIARIEDVTMNLLVAGGPQVFSQGNWIKRLGIEVKDTGNASDEESVRVLSNAIDVDALRVYRLTVGRRTRQVVGELKTGGSAADGRAGPLTTRCVRRRCAANRQRFARLLGKTYHR